MRANIQRNGFGRLATATVAFTLIIGFGVDAFAERTTDVAKLNDLSQKLQRNLDAKRPPLYYELLRAEGRTPDAALVFMRENGVPAYYTTHNLNAARTVATDDVWPIAVGGGGFYNLTGSTTAAGELAIWDGGNPLALHQEFGGRVTLLDPASPYGVQFHASHVSGTLIAAGVNANARGGSYQAPLHAYDWDEDTIEMAAAAGGGLQVSNHSYGFITGWFNNGGTWRWYGDIFLSITEDYGFGFYDTSAQEYDAIAYDAPYYLICVSAGNERDDNGTAGAHQHWNGAAWVNAADVHPPDGQSGGFDTISYFSNAKNILCVGAVDDIPAGYVNPAGVVQAVFSSWGPTDDGRIKPDIVANGIGLFSCNSTTITSYVGSSGTSMSSPNAAGSINLIAQDYEVVKGTSPLSSTLKALVINAADEAGANDGPDYSNGWGLLNTHRMADIVHAAPGADLGVLEANLTDGQTDTYFFEVSAPQDARVTIVWTDPEGPLSAFAIDPTAPRLINDLDLRVEHVATTTTTLPWRLNVAAPAAAATKADNTVDNVEQVDIDTAPAGIYRVTVTHKGSLDPSGDQDYSLVYRGMHEATSTDVGDNVPSFVLAAPYPSPVSGTATIDFTMGTAGRVSIAVYDVAGRRVASLLDASQQAAGPGSVAFNARNLPSGVYFVKMQTASQTLTKKITVVK